jgi:hypothetical protein
MAQPTIQTSFASGEWAPRLRSRVDIQKYRTGAALMRNFFVDWSGGGASTRQGTRFIQQAASNGARLIPFQPSANVSYVLEFGAGYIRFYSNGAPIFNTLGVPGSGVYQISSPYAVSDLFFNPITGNPGLKYTQDVTSMILTHPTYAPQILTILAPNSWTLTAINFGSTIATPTGLTSSTTLGTGGSLEHWNYAYEVTAVDANGQESPPTTPTLLSGFHTINDTTGPGTTSISWSAVPGAQSYNVYKASPTYTTAIPVGTIYGFIGNVTGTSFTDQTPGITPDFAQTPPVGENPFQGAGVQSYTVTTPSAYTTVPAVTLTGGSPTFPGTAQAQLGIIESASTLAGGGGGFVAGNIYNIEKGGVIYGTLKVLTTGGGGSISTWTIVWAGSITSGNTPANNLPIDSPSGGAFNGALAAVWGVVAVNVIQPGAGYTSAPTVGFSPPGAAATATLASISGGNPGCSTFFQERLVFGAKAKNVQSFDMSQPGSFFNFNTSFPVQADDAISGQIIADDLNAIRSFTNVPTGLITMTNKSAWLLNGGGLFASQSPVTPTSIVASQQAFNGANDLRPLKINMDILYNTYKGNYVRDLSYNVYANIFTGTDVTTLANHLFTGFYLVDWCWAEEPYKIAWGVRDDGFLLSLSYVKEQELIGWAHHDTDGQFLSICAVTEQFQGDTVDAVYCIAQRLVGGIYVQYVERFADRFFFYGKEDAWSVDCGLQTVPTAQPTTLLTFTGNASAVGNTVTLNDAVSAPFAVGLVVRVGGGVYNVTGGSAPAATATVVNVPENIDQYTGVPNPVQGYSIWTNVTSVSGLAHLNGRQVSGVADGNVVGPFTVSGGAVTGLPSSSKVTLGLPFTPQLQTLALDLGEPTVQSKRKKLPALTIRVADTLGLQVGTNFANLVTFKDFQLGSIPTQSNGVALVTDLVSGDGRQILDQVWQEPGQVCVQQNLPYPATILGIMPEVVVGDSPEPGGRRG